MRSLCSSNTVGWRDGGAVVTGLQSVCVTLLNQRSSALKYFQLNQLNVGCSIVPGTQEQCNSNIKRLLINMVTSCNFKTLEFL